MTGILQTASASTSSVLIDCCLSSLTHRGCSLLEVEGALNQRQRLTAEVSALGEEEQRLEQLIQRCSLDVRHMSELQSNQKYPFVVRWHVIQKLQLLLYFSVKTSHNFTGEHHQIDGGIKLSVVITSTMTY